MNILQLTPQPPYPAQQGTAIRNWAILRHLARQHAVTLLSFAAADQLGGATELEGVCRAVCFVPIPKRTGRSRLTSLLAGQADLEQRLRSPAYESALHELLERDRFDIVQVEGLELGRFIATIRERDPSVSIVYDAHNAELAIQRRAWETDAAQPARWAAAAYSWVQMRRLAWYETAVCRQADGVVCVSTEDATALKQLVPGLHVTVVSNGIDPADYAPYETAPTPADLLIFTGKMDYRPNVDAMHWFAAEILPLIQARRPAIRLEIVGQKPGPRLTGLNGRNGITVIGAVPDARPYIRRATVYVAPLRIGGGTRFKLLEAMALARPVVATTIGAEGFAVQSGRELLLADSAADFAGAVVRLLSDSALAGEIGRRGRDFVQAGYNWEAIIPRLETLHERLVARKPLPLASA
jgi:sugar transferase (PEP-CTERM/EpsH1 system associated)